MEIENLGRITKGSVDLFFRPDIECAFFGLCVAAASASAYNRAIGVFGGEEAAFLRCHVAGYIIKNVARDCFVSLISRDLECVEICDGELGLIVKHLFEMRNVPIAVDRITGKPASDMIMHSASSHFAQREQRHFEGMLTRFALRIARIKPRQEIEGHWSRKLWSVTEAGFLRVVT